MQTNLCSLDVNVLVDSGADIGIMGRKVLDKIRETYGDRVYDRVGLVGIKTGEPVPLSYRRRIQLLIRDSVNTSNTHMGLGKPGLGG